jgi:hypothetical protein
MNVDFIKVMVMALCPTPLSPPTLQIILELCIPEKELAKTRSQISFIYFQV